MSFEDGKFKEPQDKSKVDTILLQALGESTHKDLGVRINLGQNKEVRDTRDIQLSTKRENVGDSLRFSEYLQLYEAFPSILYWSIFNQVKLKFVASKGFSENIIDSMRELHNVKAGITKYDFAYNKDKKDLIFYPAFTDLPAEKNFWQIHYQGGMIPPPSIYEFYVSPEIWHFVTDNPLEMIEMIARDTKLPSYPIKQDTFSKAEAGIVIQDHYNDILIDRIFVITASSQDIDFNALYNQD